MKRRNWTPTVKPVVGKGVKNQPSGAEEHAWVTNRELYREFTSWAREHGAAKMTEVAFSGEMTRLGFEAADVWVKRNRARRWRGLRLKGPDE